MHRLLGVLVLGAILTAAAPARFGGWAVITVDSLPATVEAGRPLQIAFTVRQHGRTPMNDLEPTVIVKREGARRGDTFRAERMKEAGRYAATITAGEPGTVEITVDANWHETKITLLPLAVVARGATTSPATATARGRQLFVAKGCVTCHAKRDDRDVQAQHRVEVGPELTGRTWPADWLAAKLANPASARVATPSGDLMPNLGLSQADIAALVQYINHPPTSEVSTAR